MFTIALGYERNNAQGAQWPKNLVEGVIGRITKKTVGASTWSAAWLLDRRNRLYQRDRHLRVMHVGAGMCDIQRRAALVSDQVACRTGFAALGRRRAGRPPHTTARREQPEKRAPD